MHKIWINLIFSIAITSSSIAQTSAGQTIPAFGRLFYESIVKKDANMLLPLLYTNADLKETVRTRVTNDSLREKTLQEMDDPSFDQLVIDECRSRHARLLAQTEIDWANITYKDFKFVADTVQSKQFQIEGGSGFLYFEHQGTTYSIKVDKMAHLISGWRGHEFGPRYRKE
jgi:hypothetical protein